MKHIFVALTSMVAALAQAASPSNQSIDELFTAMNLRGTLEVMLSNMDQSIKTGMQQGLQQQGKDITPDQRKQFDQLQQKLSATLRDELSYAKMEEIYRKAYSANFTQEEINGLTAFFKSPAGKAYVDKLPAVMQAASNEVQSKMGPLVQKLNAMQQQFVQQMQSPSPSKKP